MDQSFDPRTGQLANLPPTPRAYDKPASVKLSEDLFANYKSLQDPWRKQVQEDRDFAAGAMWDEDRAVVVEHEYSITPRRIDLITPAIETAVALLTSNKPRFSVTAREDSDTRVARLFSYILAYIWEVNQGNLQLKQTIREDYISSMGWILTYWDPNAENGKGQVALKSLDGMNVFPDPDAKDFYFADAAHIILASLTTFEKFTSQYPAYADMLGNANTHYDDLIPATNRRGTESQGSVNRIQNSMIKKYMVLDRYSRIKVPRLVVYHPDSGYERVLTYKAENQTADGQPVLNLSEGEAAQFLQQICFRQITRGQIKYFIDPRSVKDAQDTFNSLGPIFHGAIEVQSGQQTFRSGAETVVEDGFQSIPGTTVELQKITMMEAYEAGVLSINPILVDRILRTYSVGGILIFEDILPIEDYPVIPLVSLFDRSVTPVSAIRQVRGLQEFVNYSNALIIEHAQAVTGFKVGYPRGAFNEADLLTKLRAPGIGVFPFDAELGTIVPVGPAPLPNEFYKMMADAKQDIPRILGIFDLMQGDPSSAPNTHRGTMAIDEFGQRRIRSRKDTIEEFLNQLCRVIIQYVQAYYTEYRVIRLLKPNNDGHVTVAINTDRSRNIDDITTGTEERINDITVGKYDAIVVSGSMLPSNRWALAEYYKELLTIGAIDVEEFLKKTEIANSDEVIERMSLVKQLQSALAQAQEQIKQLSGDMQTKDRELDHMARRVKTSAFEAELSKIKSQAQAAGVVFGERLNDELQNQKKKNAKKNGS